MGFRRTSSSKEPSCLCGSIGDLIEVIEGPSACGGVEKVAGVETCGGVEKIALSPEEFDGDEKAP